MRVALFATCLVDQLFPDVGVATVRLLRHLGIEVTFPADQTCCGQPAYNAGHHDAARAAAIHHLNVFDGADAVVVPTGSCASMVVAHYPELLAEDATNYVRARDLAGRTYDLATFLADVLGTEDVGADLSGERVTYHDGCHALRWLGVKRAPRALLRAAGAELVESPSAEVCCGFGGLFSVKMPEISAAMARTKLEDVRATEATVLTSLDGGCLMQLSGTMHRQGGGPEVVHLAELLWRGVERRQRRANRVGTQREPEPRTGRGPGTATP
ncbi:MAG: (Fe-S)-binding protein [Trueperaceae bacterium]